MIKRTTLTVLIVAAIVLLLLAQMIAASEAGPAGVGKPPAGAPRPIPGKGNGSRGCGQAPPTAIGQTETQSMVHDDLNRTYTVHLPPSYDPDTPHSLVLNFHGYGGNSEEQENSTSKMSEHADANGYIVVYPEAYPFDDGSGGLVYTWNDLACNASPGPEGPICAHKAFDYPEHPCAPEDCNYCGCQDDVGFVSAVLDALEANYCVDTLREYATGFSTGGEFVQRLGCELPDRFAAIAPVHGFLHAGFNCAPSTTISTMNVWGTNDRIIPADGSLSSDGYWYTPVDDVMDAWGSAQGCDANATPYSTVSDGIRSWTCTQRGNCTTGAEVVSCSWLSHHWWPKMNKLEWMAFGNDAIWEFFNENIKQRDPSHR